MKPQHTWKPPDWTAIFLGPATEATTIELEWALTMRRAYRLYHRAAERARTMPLAA